MMDLAHVRVDKILEHLKRKRECHIGKHAPDISLGIPQLAQCRRDFISVEKAVFFSVELVELHPQLVLTRIAEDRKKSSTTAVDRRHHERSGAPRQHTQQRHIVKLSEIEQRKFCTTHLYIGGGTHWLPQEHLQRVDVMFSLGDRIKQLLDLTLRLAHGVPTDREVHLVERPTPIHLQISELCQFLFRHDTKHPSEMLLCRQSEVSKNGDIMDRRHRHGHRHVT
mmetsp:Transcript_6311/g.17579  ORF Transcript_6311/g.17579 Transcript_6311/m.17579 type:complete len:224 (-) Transcript_6311:43-714(-)